MMENIPNNQPATPESVWALLQVNAKLMEKFSIAAEKSRIDAEKSRIDAEKRMKKLEELTGSWANNQGSFAEEYFFNSFENGKQNFFGEHFDEIAKNIKNRWQGVEDEYDIVLYNHTSVALIEVKYKAHINNLVVINDKYLKVF